MRFVLFLTATAALSMFAALPASRASDASFKAEVLFKLAHPCPATGQAHGACPGYVIDRIVPPICGGAEDPSNMQWQTLAQAKAKDKWERIGCRRGRKQFIPSEQSYAEAFPLKESGESETTPLTANTGATQAPVDANTAESNTVE